MRCPKCDGQTYRSVGGESICPNCGCGSSLSMEAFAERKKTLVEAAEPDKPVKSMEQLEHLAYHEAGHAVMSYLLRRGHTHKYSIPLEEFEKVAIEGEMQYWGNCTFSLDSLVSAAQVLLAGHASERIKYELSDDILRNDSAEDVSTARHLIASFIDEMTGENSEAVRELTPRILKDRSELAETELRRHWPAVEALAESLLKHRVLTGRKAVKIIEAAIPNHKRGSMDLAWGIVKPKAGR